MTQTIEEAFDAGKGGWWVTGAGEVWPVPDDEQHSWVLYTKGVNAIDNDGYERAFDRGFVRIGRRPWRGEVYLTFSQKVTPEALTTAGELLRMTDAENISVDWYGGSWEAEPEYAVSYKTFREPLSRDPMRSAITHLKRIRAQIEQRRRNP